MWPDKPVQPPERRVRRTWVAEPLSLDRVVETVEPCREQEQLYRVEVYPRQVPLRVRPTTASARTGEVVASSV